MEKKRKTVLWSVPKNEKKKKKKENINHPFFSKEGKHLIYYGLYRDDYTNDNLSIAIKITVDILFDI